MLRECAGTESSRNLATGILPVAKFRGNFAVSTSFPEMSYGKDATNDRYCNSRDRSPSKPPGYSRHSEAWR
jgi:hypothetical protein